MEVHSSLEKAYNLCSQNVYLIGCLVFNMHEMQNGGSDFCLLLELLHVLDYNLINKKRENIYRSSSLLVDIVHCGP